MGVGGPVTLALVAAALYGVYRFYRRFFVRLPDEPPFVRYGLPIVGPAGLFRESPHTLVAEGDRQSGGDGVFTVDLLLHEMTFLTGAKGADFLFKSDGHAGPLSFELAVSALCQHILGQTYVGHDADWEHRVEGLMIRHFINPFHMRRHEAAVKEEIAKFLALWTAADAQADGIDLFRSVSRLIMTLSFRRLLGDAFTARHGAELLDCYYTIETLAVNPLCIVAPHLPFGPAKQLVEARNTVMRLVNAEVDRRLALARASASDDDTKAASAAAAASHSSDYLDFLLRVSPQSRANFGAHFLGVLFGTHTNQTANLSWTLFHILSDAQVYRKFEAEILALRTDQDADDADADAGESKAADGTGTGTGTDNGTGTGTGTGTGSGMRYDPERDTAVDATKLLSGVDRMTSDVTLRHHMTYAYQCLQETARMLGVALIFRQTKRPIPYPPDNPKYVIPKDRIVCVAPYALHHDPKLYPAPDRYDPDRWTPEAVEARRADKTFVHFGHGRHRCLGQLHATGFLMRAFVEIVRATRMTLFTDPKTVKPEFAKSIGTPFADRPVRVRFTRRTGPAATD